MRSLKNQSCDYWMFGLLLCVFLIFAYVAFENLDIQFLAFTSGDEMPQFRQLNNLLNGFLHFDIEGMFRYEFYNYGYLYYLLNVLVTAPFNLVERYDLAIYAPRVLNGFFSILNLWVIYRIGCLYLSKYISFWIALFCLFLPGFWAFGYVFKPDVFQAFLILVCIYYLCQDSFRFSRKYYVSILFLGLAVGVAKFQAIMFLPILCFYSFYFFVQSPNFYGLIRTSLECLKIIGIVLLIWMITNPFLFHPTGVKVWWNMFVLNMQSNATNHGSYVVLSLNQKLAEVLGDFFINPLLIAIISSIFIIYVTRKIFWRLNLGVFVCVFLAFWASLLYLLFMVNKNWGIYYVSTIYLAILVLIPLCLLCSPRFVLGGIFILQLSGLFYYDSWNHFLKPSADLSAIRQKDQELVEMLAPLISNDQKHPEIYTSWVNFSYTKLGLKYSDISQIFGGLYPFNINQEEFIKRYPYKNPEKYFKQWDIIVIEKSMLERNKMYAHLDKDQALSLKCIENLDQFGYELKAQSKHFLIYVWERR